MRIGYARTSTLDQRAGLDAQLRELSGAGCDRVFSEQLSSVDASRPQLEAALDYIRDTDQLVVTKLDRLARSVRDLLDIEARLTAKGAGLIILSPAMDTNTPAGRLTFNIFGAVAQFEREIMLERQREGVQRAKSLGRYKGRADTVRRCTDRIEALKGDGLTAPEIAEVLGCSVRSIYRYLPKKDVDIT